MQQICRNIYKYSRKNYGRKTGYNTNGCKEVKQCNNRCKKTVADKVQKDKVELTSISQAQDKSAMAWLEYNKSILVIA